MQVRVVPNLGFSTATRKEKQQAGTVSKPVFVHEMFVESLLISNHFPSKDLESSNQKKTDLSIDV